MAHRISSPGRQRGSSLIEVLIAALILSFGITSIGLMMLATLRNSRDAQNYSRAITLANDIIERIQSNSSEAASYVVAYQSTTGSAACLPSGGSAATICSPAQMAESDLNDWKSRLADITTGLPGGDAQITLDTSTSPTTYTITLRWDEGIRTDTTNATNTVVQASYSQSIRL